MPPRPRSAARLRRVGARANMVTEAKLHAMPAHDGLADFLELEAKIERVGEILKTVREQAARAESARLLIEQAHLKLQQSYAVLEKESAAMRKERDEIRQRVSRLLKQLETAGAV